MGQTGTLLSKAIAPEETRGDVYIYWCPGCDEHHQIIVGPGLWRFNGDQFNPTVDGSVLVNGVRGTATEEWNSAHPRCHSFIRNGHIEYLSDCEHELANQTVPMLPFPGKKNG